MIIIHLLLVLGQSTNIKFHWKGNLTSTSITFKVFRYVPIDMRLIYWKGDNYQFFQQHKLPNAPDYPLTIQLFGLESDTNYFYMFDAFSANIDLKKIYEEQHQYTNKDLFQFKTFGVEQTPYSFNMSMSGCARTNSMSPIFRTIYQNTHPQIFLMLGDLHYENINTDQVTEFEKAYDQVFSSIPQQFLYQQVPIEYQFDDHDYGKNDADGTSITRYIANYMYWVYVPHGDLHNDLIGSSSVSHIESVSSLNEDKIGTYRIRIIGRCVMIILDLRTFSGLDQLLGAQQREWLKRVIYQISTSNWVKCVFLVSSMNFDGEGWNAFPEEQRRVAIALSQLQEQGITVLIISSDSHMTAFQNGNKHFIQDLGTMFSRGLSEAMCGSLDKSGSCKTGAVTFGPWLGRNHYTNVEVQDFGGEICLIVRGYEKEEILFVYNSCTNQDIYVVNNCPMDTKSKLIFTIVLLGCIGILYLIGNNLKNRKMLMI